MIRTDGRARPSVILITDPRWDLAHTERVIERAGRALGPGALAVQLRDKSSPSAVLASSAGALRAATDRVRALFVVNAPDEAALRIARAARADGVHVPCRQERIAEAAALFGPSAWVSVPAHADDDVSTAASARASAVLVSPILETPGKGPARGTAALAAARVLAADLAVYALGGVEPSSAAECAGAGADGVAVIRALLGADDPAAVAMALAAPFQRAARQ